MRRRLVPPAGPFTFGELFAGVSGMGMGFERAGFDCRFRVEWDKAAAGVLAHHWSETALECDVEAFAALLRRYFKNDTNRALAYVVSVIAGGSPCQDLSVAGLRAGLAGSRSGLFRTMVRICRLLQPRFVLWENVDGALSSNGGKDFAHVIGAFTGCVPEVPDDGWGSGGFARAAEPGRWNVAWRVFDSQWFGVPQRRRRVFLVGSLGDGSCVEILFEPESVRGDSPPSRETGQRVAGTLTKSSLDGSSPCGGDGREGGLVTGTQSAREHGGGGLGTDFECSGGLVSAEIAPTLNAHFGEKQGLENQHINGGGDYSSPSVANPLTSRMAKGANTTCDEGQTLIPTRRGGFFDDAIARTLTANGFDASEDGTGRSTPLVAVTPFDTTQITSAENRSQPQPGAPCHPLASGAHAPAIAFNWQAAGNQTTLGASEETAATLSKSTTQAVAFNLRGRDGGAMPEQCDAASVRAASGGSSRSYVAFSAKDSGADAGDVSPTLRAGGHAKSHQNGGVMPAIAISGRARGDDGRGYDRPEHMSEDVCGSLDTVKPDRVMHQTGVRRLTPRECERLQGWPDDHTRWRRNLRREGNTWRILHGPSVEQADSSRYKQAGNGVTTNVAEWIAHRIARAVRGEPINQDKKP